jgi:type I restriction enzyme S subunit
MKKYDNCKDSGIEWIGEIPEHWELWKISHAFTRIGSGTTPESGNPIYHENGTINWLNTGDLNDGILESCAKKVTEKATQDYSSLKVFPAGSLVMAMYGATIGKTSIINFDTTTNQACCVFCKDDIIDLKFLQYWFTGNKEQVINLAIGGGQPNISQNILKDIRVCCPVIDEQTQIANYLDQKTSQIDQLINQKKRFIELLQEERTAVINQAVTKGLDPTVKMKDSGIEWLGEIPEHWVLKRVGSLSECITGYAFKSESFSFENGIKIVRGDNVTENSLRWGDKTRYWNEYSEVLNKFQLQKNDIVIGMDGSKVGKNYAYIEENDLPLLLVQRVARIRSKNELIAKWIHYNIGSYNFKYYINLSKTDPAIPHITLKNITSYPISFPNIEELNSIIEKLSLKLMKLDETLIKSQQEIELLKEYKTALISEVITGKVDIRDVVLN